MTPRDAPLAFPQALDDDEDDVEWALSTAGAQWRRGAHSDALVWLRRAVESALASGRRIRAFQLQQQANALQVALEAGWSPSVPGSAPAATGGGDDDGTDELEPLGAVAVDLELPPDEIPEVLEATEVIDDLEEIEEVDDSEVLMLPRTGGGMFHPPNEEPTGVDQLPTLPPISAIAVQPVLEEPTNDETTQTDLEPVSQSSRPHVSDESVTFVARQAPNLALDAEPRSEERPIQEPLVESVPPRRERKPPPSVPPDGEFEQDTQRDAQADFVLSPSSIPATTPSRVSDAPNLSSDAPTVVSESPAFASDAPASGPPTSPLPEPLPESLPASRSRGVPEVAGILLSEVPGLEDLPEESQIELAERAEIHALGPDEEVGGFGLALVLEGGVAIMSAVADVAALRARRGELVFSQGHLEDGVALRVVAGPDGARVASWPPVEFERAIRDCPWVGDELRFVGDRFQALAGICMGAMGEQLDEMLRGMVVGRCEVRRLLPGDVIAEAGKPVRGMFVVGAGRIEIVEQSGDVRETLGPGDFVFPAGILQASPAQGTARAGKGGALVLFAERMVAHELMVSVPPLLEIFAR